MKGQNAQKVFWTSYLYISRMSQDTLDIDRAMYDCSRLETT